MINAIKQIADQMAVQKRWKLITITFATKKKGKEVLIDDMCVFKNYLKKDQDKKVKDLHKYYKLV
jgi:hypothetical protein